MVEDSPIERGLDYIYSVFVFEQTHNAPADIKRKWMIYDNIIVELEKMGETGLVDQIKYRITDNENDVRVFKTALNEVKNKNDKLNLLINSI